jgi:thioesterase domain-containing protein
MLPGIYGDRLELTEFQTRLSPDVAIEIIELQSLEEPLAELMSIEAVGVAVAREIEHRFPRGPVRLAGYSFGGSVAFEAAQHLLSTGRSLHFLGIIDVSSPAAEIDHGQRNSLGLRLFRKISKAYAGEYGGFVGFHYRLLRKLVGSFCSSDFRLHLVLSTVCRFWPAQERSVRRMLMWHFRRRAMSRWQPIPFQGPVFLAISQENFPSLNDWKLLCPRARVVRLPGKHNAVFHPPALEILLSAFRKAAQNSSLDEPPAG